MSKTVSKSLVYNVVILVTVVVAIGCIAYYKNHSRDSRGNVAEHKTDAKADDMATPRERQGTSGETNPAAGLPKLVDLGAGKCIPCKMMAPILEELKEEYRGRFDVVFIDVWENPEEKKSYGIRVIPTQIFYDAAGKELFRHEGFFAKDDILKKWKELKIDVAK